MIKTLSDILNGFIAEEKKKLDLFNLTHGPTIGKMYEGLTANVLNKSIPPELNLQIVSGVIYDDSSLMTGEIDCMLVKGNGISIPFTESYKWHIKDVIAVFEVKKTLYSSEIKDSFNHLKDVLDSYTRYIKDGEPEGTVNISSVIRTFSEITSIVPPSHKNIGSLDFPLEILYHTLITEYLSPIRIVLGYHGYKTEYALRKCLIDFLKANMPYGQGFGVQSFPQLIISGEYSLIKINGQPYSSAYQGNEWTFYASSRSNPVLLLLELLWTRLSRIYNLGGLWGEDLKRETFVPLLKGKVVKHGDITGWEYNYHNYNNKELKEFDTSYEWEPVYLNSKQFTVMNRLCIGELEDIGDQEFISFIEKDRENFNLFVKSLLSTGLVGLNGRKLQLITKACQCVILPNGKFAAAENNSGRLSRWLLKNVIWKKTG